MKTYRRCLLPMLCLLILPTTQSAFCTEATHIPEELLTKFLNSSGELSKEIEAILLEYGEEVAKAVVLQYEPKLQAVSTERNEYKAKTETFSNLIALQAATIQEREARIKGLERSRLPIIVGTALAGMALGATLTVVISQSLSRQSR